MKNFYVLTIIFLLSSCQTLSSIQETLGLVQEDPNAPVKLDENYESFLDAVNDDKIMLIIKNRYKWPKDISREIIDLLEDYIKSEGFRK